MDDFLDECLFEVSSNSGWECPNCKNNGFKSQVKLYQLNTKLSMFFCEKSGCLYPYEESAIDEIPLVKREVIDTLAESEMFGDLPVNELTVRQLRDVVWLRVFLPSLDSALEMMKVEPIILDGVEVVPKYKDPDVKKLIGLPVKVLDYAEKHLRSDIKDIVDSVKIDFF